MAKLFLLILLIAVAALAWMRRDRFMHRFSRENAAVAEEAELQPSAELAEIAEAKLENLKQGRSSSAALHATELQSLLQFRFIQLLPAFVDEPEVELRDSQVEVTARVPVDRLPSISEIGDAAAFLPDTAEVSLTGRLLPLDEGRVALSIQEVKAARIPLPQRLVPSALQRLGRRDEPGLPRNALALPLPKGASSAYLDSDSLVLIGGSVKRSRN
jgi:hypothetical protein